MPRGDRTGPAGMGPGSGRRMGYCAGNDAPGFVTGGRFGMRGSGFNGRGRGFRHRFFASGMPFDPVEPNPNLELSSLKAQADMLKNELQAIENRLNSINKDSQKESEA